MNKEKSDKEDNIFLHIDGAVIWVRIVFIIILLFPLALYFSTKIDIEKSKEVAEISEEPSIENGIDLQSGLIVDEGYEIVKGT